MDRLLSRLERRIGWLAIPNLATIVVALSAMVWAMGLVRPGLADHLILIPDEVARGEVWRLITFVFVLPATSNLFFGVMSLLFYYWIASSLEAAWGSFKFNAYYVVGVLGTIASALIVDQPMASWYLHISLLLAFGTVFPNEDIYLYFLLPVKAKWFAVFAAGGLIYLAVLGSFIQRLGIAVAIGNYLIFFAQDLIAMARGQRLIARQRGRRADLVRAEEVRPRRKCAVCGVTDEDGADLRVCNCQEFCGGKVTVYCLPHARSHNQPVDRSGGPTDATVNAPPGQ